MTALVTENLSLLTSAPNGIKKLRQLILTLAVQGRLVPQDQSEQPAAEFLSRIAAHKADAAARGRSRRPLEVPEPTELAGAPTAPPGWLWTTFGNATVCRDGERIPVSQVDRDQRKKLYDYYGASGVIDKIDGYLFDKPLLLIGEDGANLVNRSSPIAFIARGQYWVNNHAHVIDGVTEGLLKYLELYINAIDLKPYVTGTAQPKMNQAKLNAIPLALPPEAEQHRIVAKVDELMALCDRLEVEQADAEAAHVQLVQALVASLTQARDAADFRASWQQLAEHFHTLFTTEASIDALKQAVLQLGAMGKLAPHTQPQDQCHAAIASIATKDLPFALPPGWRWVRLGQLCKLVTSGSRGWKDFYAESGSIFIRSQDIKADKLEFDNRAFVQLPPSAEGARTLVSYGDLLVTITGANVGKAAHITQHIDDVYVSQHVALIRLVDPIQSPFIHRWLINALGGRAMLLASSYGAKPGLNLQNIKDLPVPLPPIAEQQKIVAKVDQLLALCDRMKNDLAGARLCHAHLASLLVEQAQA